MRIISGRFGGRRLDTKTIKNWKVRPTTDLAREGLFNILENSLNFKEIKMLDLFGGLGGHTLEAISRGCTSVTFVDKFRLSKNVLLRNLSKLDDDCIDHVQIRIQDGFKFLKKTDHRFDYIFADPPYDHLDYQDLPQIILGRNLLLPNGLLVIEHDQTVSFSNSPYLTDLRNYGRSYFSFFQQAISVEN